MRDVDERGIEAIARKHHAGLILQFGSTVSGKTHPRSDLDIAVLLERPHVTLRDHAELLHDLQSLSETREVDLVILNRADPLLLKQVSDRCVRLYGSDAEFPRLGCSRSNAIRTTGGISRWSGVSSKGPSRGTSRGHDRPRPRFARSPGSAAHRRRVR